MTNPLEGLSFQVLFEAIADAMLLVDDTGHVVQANASALQMFEYVETEIVGLKVEALMPAPYRDYHQDYRKKFFITAEKRSMGKGKSLVALTRSGGELPVDIGLSPFQVLERQFVLVTLHPIDKRIVAEASLRTSEELLRLAKLVAGLGIYDVNLKVSTIQCDERVCELWGITPDEVMSHERFLEGIHFADRPIRQAAVNHAAEPGGGGEYRLEYRVNNLADKSQRWVFMAGKVFCEDGHATRLVGVVQDITERKLLEQKLNAHRMKMEVLAKQQVAIQTAAAIAHELNQPLAAISAYSEVALHALDAGAIDADKLNRSLEGCVAQAQRAGQSLHELLEFLQKGEVAVRPIHLNEIVKEALQITQSNGDSGFYPTLHLAHNLPQVLANHTQVQKVLVNLLRNGIEAVHSIGIPIAIINVTVHTEAGSNMAQVTVQDNGPGVDNQTMKRLFEPFFTTKAEGIGMGLAVSRELIEANGGQLWFDPESNAGATFHFTLPFAS